MAIPLTFRAIHEWKQSMRNPDNKQSDNIHHPKHYTQGRIQPIDVIEDWHLDFHLGNVIKYLARAYHKSNLLEDLEKAKWYLDRKISEIKDLTRNTEQEMKGNIDDGL